MFGPRVTRFILDNHTLSEAFASNVQMLLTFVPGRWGEWEVACESVNAALNTAVLLEDLAVHEHLRQVVQTEHPSVPP